MRFYEWVDYFREAKEKDWYIETNDYIRFLFAISEGDFEESNIDVFFSDSSNSGSFELHLLCNDLFSWASADVEHIKKEDLPVLVNHILERPRFGDVVWVCTKNNCIPQESLVRYMEQTDEGKEALQKIKDSIK